MTGAEVAPQRSASSGAGAGGALPAGVCLTLATVDQHPLQMGVPRVHVSVPCTVCAASADLFSLTSMVEAGWSFAWTPTGHFLTVPGVKSFPLQCTGNSSLAYLVIVLVPGTEADPRVTFYDDSEPSHRGLTKHSFLIDTGADHSLMRVDKEHLLARKGSFNGAGGPALPILGAGYLDFVFPSHSNDQRGWVGMS